MSTMATPQALPALDHVRAIAPYQAGKPIEELAREFGLDPKAIVKLASNENPLGIPASARQAMHALIHSEELARYPDSNGFALKAALANKYRVPADWITLGNGSNDILELVASVCLAPGRSCVYAQHAFAVYALATQARGAQHVVVPAQNFGHDLNAMRAAITDDTHLLYLANPNNPTGTFLPAPEMAAFLAQVPRRVVVVIDEAYNEYLAPEQRFDSTQWVRAYPNVLVCRTFSKAYGLAGLRVGYGLAQAELTDVLNRVRQPFNVNSLAQAAALAALGDEEFLARSYQVNRDGLQQLTQAFHVLGLKFVPSAGNFVLVHLGAQAGAIHQSLLASGVIVRPVANYGLSEWLRVSVGLAHENDRFIQVLATLLGKSGEISRSATA